MSQAFSQWVSFLVQTLHEEEKDTVSDTTKQNGMQEERDKNTTDIQHGEHGTQKQKFTRPDPTSCTFLRSNLFFQCLWFPFNRFLFRFRHLKVCRDRHNKPGTNEDMNTHKTFKTCNTKKTKMSC